ESDDVEGVDRKLREAVASVVSDLREATWVESHLRLLAGITVHDEDDADRRSEAFAAWRRFFEGMAEQRPLVLVFEDLHWADDELLDFIDHLIEWATGVPILIVCTSRPELFERRPAWGGGQLNATTMSLAPLSEADTSRLLGSLIDRPLLTVEREKDLLARAGGNPLYAEQYAHMVLEGPGSTDLPVPETVQGIIAARLDRLPQEEKALLQDAAVLGKVFWLGGILEGRERRGAEAALHALDRKGFVQRVRSSSVADELEYAFLHLLVRDVAYGQIPRADRAAKHRGAGQWIESLGRAEDHAEALAHHYSSALELARLSGQATDEFAERARIALREAGARAMALNAFEAAARSYASALELWPKHDTERPRVLLSYGKALALGQEAGEDELAEALRALVELGDREHAAEAEIMLADARWRVGQRDSAYQHLERAVGLVAEIPSSATKARVLSEVSRYHMLGERTDEAIRIGREALEMATALGLDEIRAHALTNIGTARAHLGDPNSVDDLQQGIEIANRIGSPESLRAYNNLFASYTTLGYLDQAAETVRAGLEVADRFGSAGTPARFLRYERVHIAYWEGRWDESLRLIEESLLVLGPEHVLSRWSFEIRGRIRLARDDVSGALADAETSLAVARQAKDPQTLYPALSFSAVASLEAGHTQDCARLADELLALKPTDYGIPNHVSPLFDLAWALTTLDRGGDLVEAIARGSVQTRHTHAARAFAQEDYGKAADMYAEIGARPNEAYTRLRAAAQLVEAGRRPEADGHLHQALAFWQSAGATRHIREGKSLLGATV
ncbi:MAG: hypothetical protein QOK34_1122, partial [Gaiellaceae bacterium]|nr:hypothetical protein [Gaiellaceae bacterium]